MAISLRYRDARGTSGAMPVGYCALRGLQVVAAIMVVASPVQAADNYILGRCIVSQLDTGVEIRPTYNGNSYLVYYHASNPHYQGFSFNSSDTKVTLVKAPAHGKVEHDNSEISNNYYHYVPNEGYFGQDNFVMQVEKNGIKVRIHYLVETVPEDEPTNHLCNPDSWKISSTTPVLDNARLQALLGAANINSMCLSSSLTCQHVQGAITNGHCAVCKLSL